MRDSDSYSRPKPGLQVQGTPTPTPQPCSTASYTGQYEPCASHNGHPPSQNSMVTVNVLIVEQLLQLLDCSALVPKCLGFEVSWVSVFDTNLDPNTNRTGEAYKGVV